MHDSLRADLQVRALLPVVARRLRKLHTVRTARIIRINRTLRVRLRVAMDQIMDPGMVSDMAIVMAIVRDIGVGLPEYLFNVKCPNSIVVVQSQSGCGFNRWNIIFPSLESKNGNM